MSNTARARLSRVPAEEKQPETRHRQDALAGSSCTEHLPSGHLLPDGLTATPEEGLARLAWLPARGTSHAAFRLLNNLDLVCHVASFLDSDALRRSRCICKKTLTPLSGQCHLSFPDAVAGCLVRRASRDELARLARDPEKDWISQYQQLLFLRGLEVKLYSTLSHVQWPVHRR